MGRLRRTDTATPRSGVSLYAAGGPGRSSPLSGAGEPGRVTSAVTDVPPERDARKSQNDGTTSATTAIATTTTTPPDTIATVTPAAVASVPARRSPSRGPPATTTMN